MREEYLLGMSAFFEVLVTYRLFNHFYERKPCSKKTGLVVSGAMMVIITVISLCKNVYLNTTSMLVIQMLYAKLLFKCRASYALFGSFVFVMMGVAAEVAAGFGVSFALDVDLLHVIEVLDYKVIVYFISNAVLLLLTHLIISVAPSAKQSEARKPCLYLIVFPVFSILNELILLYLTMRFQVERNIFLFCMLVGIGLIYGGILLIIIYEQSIQKCVLENELQLARQKEDANERFYNLQEKNLEEVRAVIHDFKKQLVHLREMYQKEEGEAAKYHKLLMETLEEQVDRQVIDLNNKVLSSILQRARIVCEQRKISLTVKNEIYDLGFLSPMDTSAIFDNAIDNAVEACMKLQEEAIREIRLHIRSAGYFILIEFKNTYSEEPVKQEGILLTGKRDKKAHGYGIRNICNTAQKYGGDGACYYKDGIFTLLVRLQKPEM